MEAETLDPASDICLKNSSKVWWSTDMWKEANPNITLARVRVRVAVLDCTIVSIKKKQFRSRQKG